MSPKSFLRIDLIYPFAVTIVSAVIVGVASVVLDWSRATLFVVAGLVTALAASFGTPHIMMRVGAIVAAQRRKEAEALATPDVPIPTDHAPIPPAAPAPAIEAKLENLDVERGLTAVVGPAWRENRVGEWEVGRIAGLPDMRLFNGELGWRLARDKGAHVVAEGADQPAFNSGVHVIVLRPSDEERQLDNRLPFVPFKRDRLPAKPSVPLGAGGIKLLPAAGNGGHQ